MKVLVTGGAGFIGSHVVEALLEDGCEVEVLDNLSTGQREYVADGVPLHVLDITSPEAAEIVANGNFDALIHHAAQIDVRRSVRQPAYDAGINILGTVNLLEACRASLVRRFIFASTGGAIYGDPVSIPQAESHPLAPASPYGLSKLSAERYLELFDRHCGIRYVALRYGNVYGPRQSPHGEAGVVAIFASRMLSRENPVIFGDGRQTRDYVYVEDVARANMMALAYSGPSICLNIGTGRETDVITIFESIRQCLAVDIEPEFGKAKAGEQRRSVLCCDMAASVLPWTPQLTLEGGLARTTAWFASNGP